MNNLEPNKKSRKRWIFLVFLLSFVCICGLLFWFSPFNSQPIRNILNGRSVDQIYGEGNTLLDTLFSRIPLGIGSKDAVCGNVSQWQVLGVGIDERDSEYLYGLADVIRIVRIDFENPQINVVALPRATLVNPPPGLDKVPAPLLLNQAYFFGSPGMNYFEGSGFGAGALAATLQSNFGVKSENYLVVDFQAFVRFIDAIGGIEVDLPTYVDDLPSSYFPAGKQFLDGAQALTLARVRSKYSDLARIENQTIVLKGIFQKLKNPATIVRLPKIYASLIDSFQTDASPAQISSVFCLLSHLESDDIHFYNPPEDLLIHDWEFIPNMNQQMEVFRWDERLINWIKQSLSNAPAP